MAKSFSSSKQPTGISKTGRSNGKVPSSSFKFTKSKDGNGGSSSRYNNSSSRFRANARLSHSHNQSNYFCHAPLLGVLLIGVLVPFISATVTAWYVFTDNTSGSLEKVFEASKGSLDNLITSKLDSVIDSEVEAFRALYEGSVKVVDAGAFLEHAIGTYSYDLQQKKTAFWTQTISEAYHYRNTYFIFACHGHILGTGFDPKTKEYIAYYTDLHIFDNNTSSFTAPSGVVYDDTGCSNADLFGSTSRELTHTKRFTDENYWANILEPSYKDHDTVTYEDGRLRQWYINSHKTDDACTWTLPYVADQTPVVWDEYISTISMKTYDSHGHEHGVVAIDVSLNRLGSFIQELSITFPGTYSVVLTNEQRVMAGTDGKAVHVFEVNGETTSELFEFYDYAENIKRDTENDIYLSLADYLYQNPEYFATLQKTHFDIGDENLRPKPEHFKVYTDSNKPVLVSALHMTDHCGLDATLFIMTDEDIFLKKVYHEHDITVLQFDQDTLVTLATAGAIAVVAIISIIILSRGVTGPLKVMGQDIAKVQELDFAGGFDLLKPFVSELASISQDYAGLKKCMERFKCFVPPQIISELVSSESGNGTKREVEATYISTLVCDVANFTKAAHKADQKVVLDFANAFLGGSADLIVKNGGTVIDFFGDQIFGIFNAPVEDPDFLEKTLKTATMMLSMFDDVKKHYMKKDPVFGVLDVRIGLHCGSALVGKIGSENRIKYCAIGENVNLGARLEGLNKRYNSRMTCSSDFLFSMPRDVKKLYTLRPMEFIRVRRREAPVLIYEIAGVTSKLPTSIVQEFEEHQDIFQRVKAKRITPEELDAYIKEKGGNAKFLKSSSMLSDSNI